jgi:hypothetical protein
MNMRKTWGRWWVGVAAALLVGATSAHADPIRWDYSTTGLTLGQGTDLDPSYHGIAGWYEVDLLSVPMTHESGSTLIQLLTPSPTYPNSDGVVTHIVNQGDGGFFPLVTFVDIPLTITDLASRQSALVSFNLYISATWQGGWAYLNGFSRPNENDISRVLTLGGNRYTITPLGNTDVQIDVAPVPQQYPEPSSLVLAGLGLCGLGAAAWRKRWWAS